MIARYWIAALGLATALSLPAAAMAQSVDSEAVDFQKEILPLLSDRCFTCHGPDEGTREAGLRLDTQDGALAVLAPGDLDSSELWSRITSQDADLHMPPVESNLTLSDAEIDTVKRWIEQGARWEGHWAFERLPATIPIPETADDSWSRSPLDRFVLAGLRQHDQQPAPETPRWRWLRRVTFDLTGLPPTPEEIHAFESDTNADAYDKVVDRLLASPRFGERMATSWLDAARYADSYGYQSDMLNSVWPWRDWVVRALNANLPYDAFLTWQLAGDLLDEPTQDQILATTFNRLHRMTNEGGSLEPEWRFEGVCDRVNTLGTSVLGLTLGCARCHDHKYDPVSQQDYYNLFSYFNSIDEWGLYHDTSRVPTPTLLFPDADQAASIAAANRKAAESVQALQSFRETFDPDAETPPEEIGLHAAPLSWFPMDTLDQDKWIENLMAPDQIGNTSGQNKLVEGRFGKAIQVFEDDPCEFPYLETGLRPWEPFAVSFWLYLPEDRDEGMVLHSSSGTDCGFFGTELVLEQGRLRYSMTRFWPGNAIALRTATSLPKAQWVHIVIGNYGTGTADGLQLYVDGRADNQVLRDALTKRPNVEKSGFQMGARLRSVGLIEARLDELYVFDHPLSKAELRLLAANKVTLPASEFTDDEIRDHRLMGDYRFEYLVTYAAQCCRARLDAAEAVLEVPVMEELDKPAPAWVMARGRYDADRNDANRAARAAPGALPAMPESAPQNRLGLAQWLVSHDHPLTSRVAVNRLWSSFFGNGLVTTMDDFGLQGATPTHPQLLDWLARDFVDSGWDVKRLCRQIVLSSTYRQASGGAGLAGAEDPGNALLGRGPGRRLSAEMIRDQALFVAGLLDERRGGPPVSPYQPENLWQESNSMTPEYKQSVGKDLYRRSLYTVWKRATPMPNMVVFDAPAREVCSLQRSQTNTPLQALVLMNDVQFVEAARVMATRYLEPHTANPESAITELFLALTSRPPDAQELRLLEASFREQLSFYETNAEQADALLDHGESLVPDDMDRAELAAMTIVAQLIMNSDAAIWKR